MILLIYLIATLVVFALLKFVYKHPLESAIKGAIVYLVTVVILTTLFSIGLKY